MTQPALQSASELEVLESKINQLINSYQAVKQENQILVAEQQKLQHEKKQLLEKTTLARTRVVAMIKRLETLEQTL